MVDYVLSYLLNDMTDWHWDNLSGCFFRIGGLKFIRLHCGFRIKEILQILNQFTLFVWKEV